jgi:hypothetical protein
MLTGDQRETQGREGRAFMPIGAKPASVQERAERGAHGANVGYTYLT